MKVEQITTPPQEVPVATLTVTQKELDLLTALVNECGSNKDETGYQMYMALAAVGGDGSNWNLNMSDSPSAWSVVFFPEYKA